MEDILHYQGLLYVLDIIQSKLVSYYYYDSLANQFRIKTTQKLVAKKYFWCIFRLNIETYVKDCNIGLTSKLRHHKLYGDLQSLLMCTYCQKDHSINFVIGFLLLMNWKSNNYNIILVVIDCLTKMLYYKPVKTTINVASLAEVIIDLVIRYYSLLESIISNWSLLLISKF